MRYLEKILAEDVTKIFRKSQKKLLAWDLAKKSYIEKTWRGANLAPPGPDRVNSAAGSLYVKRSKVINTSVREWWLSRSYSALW